MRAERREMNFIFLREGMESSLNAGSGFIRSVRAERQGSG